MSKVIDEKFLQQLETLQMLVKQNVAGMFGGNHLSKTFGSSCEFADYRDYIAGDDITKIDWNVYARFEKLYLKLYLDERQMHTRIYIDTSRSMGYGKSKKDEQTLKIAAALAYLSICEMDKVSIYLIRGKRLDCIISDMHGKDAYFNKIGKLNRVVFDGDSFISGAIIPSVVGYGDGMSIIISDFLTDNNYDDAIYHLSKMKRDVFCVQVLSKEELVPQARGKLHYFDSEDNNVTYRKNIHKDIVVAYKKALAFVTYRLREICYTNKAHYSYVCAEDNVLELFFNKFAVEGVIK